MLDPVGERRVRDETKVNRRPGFRALDVDLVSAEAERGPAAPERLDLHAEHTLVEPARLVHVADGQDEMVEAVEIKVWHASDSIPASTLTGQIGASTAARHACSSIPTVRRDWASSSDRIDLDPLPRPSWHRLVKELGVNDLGQDLEALRDARARSVEVGGAVDGVDVS